MRPVDKGDAPYDKISKYQEAEPYLEKRIILRKAREKYLKQNSMSMKEIDDEIENCRRDRNEWIV